MTFLGCGYAPYNVLSEQLPFLASFYYIACPAVMDEKRRSALAASKLTIAAILLLPQNKYI